MIAWILMGILREACLNVARQSQCGGSRYERALWAADTCWLAAETCVEAAP